MLEAQIQKEIIQYLHLKRYFFWRNYVGPIIRGRSKKLSQNPMAGMPDILGVFNTHHRLFAIEVKTERGTLSPKQKVWIQNLEDAGAFCMVARSVKDVIEQFTMYDTKDEPCLKTLL